MHFVRKIGNNGAHGEEVNKKQAVSCLHALHDSVVGILEFLGVIEEANAFKASFYDTKPVVSEPVAPKAIEEVEIDKEALSKYKESIDESITLKATQDITEAEKAWLLNAHYEVEGTGDDTVVTKHDDTHYELAEAMSRYDYMVENLGMNNFLNKSGLVQNASRLNLNNETSESSVVIVIVVALISVTSLTALLVIKRRRVQQ